MIDTQEPLSNTPLPFGLREETTTLLRAWVRKRFGVWITWKTAWTAARVICAPATARIAELEACLRERDKAEYAGGARISDGVEIEISELQSRLASQAKLLAQIATELSMARGVLDGIEQDAEDLARWWPPSKRGSNAARSFKSILERADAGRQCVSDAETLLKLESQPS